MENLKAYCKCLSVVTKNPAQGTFPNLGELPSCEDARILVVETVAVAGPFELWTDDAGYGRTDQSSGNWTILQ